MRTTKETIISNTVLFAAFTAMSLLAMTACVKEYPEDGHAMDPTEIELTIELSTDPSVTAASAVSKSMSSAGYAYFVIELYKDEFGGDTVFRREISAPVAESGTASVTLTEKVHAGTYRLAAFAARTESEDGSGCVYDLSDLSNIVFSENGNAGSCPMKECYDLRMDIELAHDKWFGSDSVSGILTAPVGRVEVISEDAPEFIDKNGFRAMAAEDDFWQNYEVRWEYAMYFPTGYNVLTGQPNKSETGVGFVSDLIPLENDEVLMGYDYVFVNGDNTEVSITLSLYDRTTGECINTYSGLNAGIYKGQTTVIRGKYLTTEKKPGVNLDPDFEGEINIDLNL